MIVEDLWVKRMTIESLEIGETSKVKKIHISLKNNSMWLFSMIIISYLSEKMLEVITYFEFQYTIELLLL